MKKVEGEAKKIRELLENSRFYIDYYQRDYKWQTKHVNELLNDLTERFLDSYDPEHDRDEVEDYENYFLGSIILCDKNKKKYIIDGQQRLTTLTLLLIYLKHRMSDEDQRSKLLNLIYSDVYGKKSFNINVKERNPFIKSIFDGKDLETNDKPESIKNIILRYKDIDKLFPSEINEKSIIFFSDWLIENVYLVEITAHTDEDAYIIFETMNDRGLSLNPLEMLKGYLLTNITDEDKRNNATDIWKNIIEKIKKLGKDEDTDAIKAWLRSQYADSIRERKKNASPQDFDRIGTEFHRWVKDNNEKLNLKSSDNFFDFINKDFEFYADNFIKIRNAAEILTPGLECIFYNAVLAFTLQYPLLLSPLRINDDEETINKKLKIVSSYIDIIIARRVWNFSSIAYSYMQYAMFLIMKEIRNRDTDELSDILYKRLITENNNFRSSRNFRLHQQNKFYIHQLLARITEYIELSSGMPSRFKEYIAEGKNRHEIEHIWADHFDRHSDEFNHPADFAEYRNHVGGLLLLPKSFNGSYGDLPYKKKLKHYYGQNLLAKSLNPRCYEHEPGFLRFKSESGLEFKPHEEFKKKDLDERQNLYIEIAEKIWSPERLKVIVD
jgi:uncharacterized protein with ParB-like and HNH nuclease domain